MSNIEDIVDSLENKISKVLHKLELLKHRVYDDNFDIKDLIESEEDLMATNLKLIQLQKTNKDQLEAASKILFLCKRIQT